ncbi:basement membrane-specific heparan sulfate proteoglycan core protein isoform X1 [Hydra vulgaris]|uniref:basement membrane-specific heparan sulfate proteoglycan core protein isoform X1 n=1 Tax=Hydra vulgaris TaxID=6087 RepID=UPI0032E9EA0F
MDLFGTFIFLLSFLHITSANKKILQKSSPVAPQFKEVRTTSRSIYLSWEIPYFSLRTVLLYKQDQQEISAIHISNGVRNHTLESLEPGMSYMVILQIYYSSAYLETVTNIITTKPIDPDDVLKSEGFEIEIQLLIKSNRLSSFEVSEKSTTELAEKTLRKIRKLLSNFSDVKNIYIYSIREELSGVYLIMYLNVTHVSSTQTLFDLILKSQNALGCDPIGFTFKIISFCCKPIYFHSFSNETEHFGSEIIHLQIVHSHAFQPGICGTSFDMSKGDITIETRGQHMLTALTISLYIKLKNLMDLHPVISAVNFYSQLRLEVQEGRLVWMFYNIGNSQGFIISSSDVIKKDTWMHILVDYSTHSGLGRIFIDGNLQKKKLSNAVLSTHWMLGLRIGKYFSGGVDYKMDGYIDEFQIFGCTLTLREISILSKSCGKVNQCLNKKDNITKMTSILFDSIKEWKKNDELQLSGVSECNSAGVSLEETESSLNKCKCKKNVEGYYCEKCKDGFFNLQLQNKDGCTKCFCNGLTKNCRSAKLERKQNVLNANDIYNINLRTIEGYRVNKDNILYNPITNSVTYKADSLGNGAILYWELPLSYCGDKVTSYGGNLRFTISYMSKPFEKPLYGPDVILLSNGTQLAYTEGKEPLSGIQHHFQVILDERFWLKGDNEQVTREEFIIALANIQSFLLRATYSTDIIESNLYEVRLDVVEYDPMVSNNHVTSMVEECLCPPEYFGTSCQHCNKGFTKVKDLLLRKCTPCQCNNHADDCDGSSGICRNCLHFTTGDHCEKCLPGYYGDPRSGRHDACLKCPCPLTVESNQFSSTCLLDTDGEPTCDACKRGYTGRNCEKCLHPYIGDPLQQGGSCTSPNAGCECDMRGVEHCNNSTCLCKKNVIGEKCSHCKPGSFYLHKKNKDGCLKCWCFGVTDVCKSSENINFNFKLLNMSGVKITNFEETINISKGLYVGFLNEAVLSDLPENRLLYWSLPDSFHKEKLIAYGGVLSYTISYEEIGSGYIDLKPDVIIKGNGKSLVYQAQTIVYSREIAHMEVPIHEEKWTKLSGGLVSREEFLFVLSNISSFLIRATYNTRIKSTLLRNVSLSWPTSNKSDDSVKSIEVCECPIGYSGTSCQRCATGFFRFITPNGELRCKKCQCNGHSEYCDDVTGICTGCKNNTKGEKCNECKLGFFSDSSNGGECKPCFCPLSISTNQFSKSCTAMKEGGFVCDTCKTGYSGRYCGECAVGYTGNPLTPGGTCKKSAVRYTSEPSVKITPEIRKDRLGTISTFHCSATGEQPLMIQWSRIDGRPFASNVKFASTPTSKTLTITKIDHLDEQTYICSARNDYGLSSARAVLNVVSHRLLPIRVSVVPKSLYIEQGGVARFICNHDSDLTTTITWSREDFEKLPAEALVKNGIFTISNVNQGHSGLYSCRVSNQYSYDQVSVQLRVGVSIPPKVAIYPNEVVSNINEDVQFRCSFSGYPTPTISWERETGKSMSGNVIIEESLLQIKNVQVDDEGQYFCTASNQGGTVSSRSVLYVRGPNSLPIVNIIPSEFRVQSGTTVLFLCSYSGIVLKLIWRKKNGNLPTSSVVRDRELHIPATDLADEGQYECVASNQYGEVIAKSNLFVEPDPGFKPRIQINPKFVSVIEGSYAEIQCNVTGLPLPIVLWSKPNGLLTNNHVIEGSYLKILKVSADDSGTYVCSGQNRLGSDSSTSVLSVERRMLPEITINSAVNVNSYVGESLTFFCKLLGGIPKPTLMWKTSSGYQVPSSQLKNVDDSLALKLFDIKKSHEGEYICVASNAAGIQEKKINLTVKGDARVLFKPRGLYRAKIGDKVTIRCYGYGYPAPFIILTVPNYDSKGIYNITHNEGYIEFTFVVEFVLAGNYTCTGRNLYGEKHDFLSLIVRKEDEAPLISKLPQSTTINYLSTFKMVCKAQGTPNPKIFWTRGQAQSKISNKHLLQIDSVVIGDEDDYQCHAVNRKGSVVSSTKLVVRVMPTVNIFPPSIIVKQGHGFTIKCLVKSRKLYSIQWRKQGFTNLVQFSSILFGDELFILSANKDDAGMYICIYKDDDIELNSTANVTVIEPPLIIAASETVFRVNLNSSITLKCNVSGYPSPFINWIFPDGSNGASNSYGEFALVNMTKYDQGQYKCRASNVGGFAEETFTVLINELPQVVILEGTHMSANYGSHVSITCKASGVPLPTVQWSKRQENITKNIKTENGVLNIYNVTSEHSGTFRCVAKNDIGSVLSEVQLHVKGAPQVSVFPSSLSVSIKELVKFSCNVTGHPKPKVTWLKLNGVLPNQIYISEDFLVIPSVKVSDAGVYLCRAENLQGTGEASVTLKVLDFVPHFFQEDSMQVFENIPNTQSQTKINIWFKPDKPDGLLIYRGSSVKDFLSLIIRDHYVIFCFNLGSGSAIIKTTNRFELHRWVSVEAKQDQSIGFLKVNDDNPVYGKSLGRFNELNLDNELYLGGYEDVTKIVANVGFITSFSGCVSELIVNNQRIEFVDAITSKNVASCNTCHDNPCKNSGICNPSRTKFGFVCMCMKNFTGVYCEDEVERCYPDACLYEGQCVNHEKNGYSCKCLLGRFGKRCAHGFSISVPLFNESSFLSFHIPNLRSKVLTISFSFKVQSVKDFKVLSIEQTFQNKFKFLNFAVEKGSLVLKYNLGDGTVILNSEKKVILDQWLEVHFELKGKYSSLSINGQQALKNVSNGLEDSLNLNTNTLVYIGNGLIGCLRQLVLNSKKIDLSKEYVAAKNILSCYKLASPCLSKSCLNGGTCVMVSDDDFICKCTNSYDGILCEKKIGLCENYIDCKNNGICKKTSHGSTCFCPLGFSGLSCQQREFLNNSAKLTQNSYILFRKVRIVEKSRISFLIKTAREEGMLLWLGQKPDSAFSSAFMLVGIKKGTLEIQFELGSKLVIGFSKLKVNDDRWHSIGLLRQGSTLICMIDEKDSFTLDAGEINVSLDFFAYLYLGGGISTRSLSQGKYLRSYEGCVQNFILDGDVSFVLGPDEAWNILPCE